MVEQEVMSKLVKLLSKVYELKAKRKEDDIGMTEPYWQALNDFRVAHAEAGHPMVSSEEAKIAAGIEKIAEAAMKFNEVLGGDSELRKETENEKQLRLAKALSNKKVH